ncbi:Ig-like domain-containing protein [Prosthecobacter sp. SYSU 5D2]|uniref:Ig-like domain-containing protein n=1 Tax=Prosthecobacter sp. SYSU 5D2 TaxID=3134134 RepID=UPI0031FECC1F
MKKIFLALALALSLVPLARSATLTVSNYNGLAAHGIASSESTLVAEGKGFIGRMTISDGEVETLLAAGNITALVEAFEVFGSAATPFPVTSFAQNGLFENQITFSTAPSAENDFAGSSIFIWLFVGANRLDATEILLAKLPAVFPADPEEGPPVNASVFLRPDATFFAGAVSAQTHDYGLGDGAVAKLEMEVQFFVPPNQPPVALAGTLTIDRGLSASGTVTGTDADDDTLTFFVVDEPTKGTVDIEEDGSYLYTSTAGQTGNDSFTFRAYDGKDYSAPATVAVTIVDNNPPVAIAGTLSLNRGQTSGGTVTGTDADLDALTFFVVDAPAKGTLDLEEDGTYEYTATAGLTGNDSFTFRAFDGLDSSTPATVTITISDLPPGSEAPVIAISTLDPGYVGSYYEFEVAVANAPQGNASTFTAKGLPSGLKMNKTTGVISGYPTKAFTDKEVTLFAKNSVGDSGNVVVTITIDEVPAAAVGTFLAAIERKPEIADGFGGRLNLTTTTKGAFTAKLLSGSTAYSAKGKLTISDVGDVTVVGIPELEFTRKGQPTLIAELTFDIADGSIESFQLTGTLKNPEDISTNVFGVRNTWTKTSKPTQYTGSYTYSLRLPDAPEFIGNPLIPQGDGFGALTVTDKGTATLVGRTADGKSFTVPTILGPRGDLPIFSPFAVKTSSLVGIPKIDIPEAPSATVLNSITGAVSWMKPPAETKSKDRAYRDGFEAFDLTLSGGMYLAPASGGVVAGLADNGTSDTQANAWLTFSGGGLLVDDIDTFPFTIMNKKDTGIKQTVIVPKSTPKTPDTNPNPNTVTFKLLSKPAGYFSGTFTLPNEVKSLTRKTPFQGTFVRHSDGSWERVGFFLLAELPEGSEKVTTSPQNSGLIELLAAPPVLSGALPDEEQ